MCTRCFDLSLTGTALVPMADQYNHSDTLAGQSFVVKRMMLEERDNPNHFGMSKYMNDYSDFFKDELKVIDSSESKSKL